MSSLFLWNKNAAMEKTTFTLLYIVYYRTYFVIAAFFCNRILETFAISNFAFCQIKKDNVYNNNNNKDFPSQVDKTEFKKVLSYLDHFFYFVLQYVHFFKFFWKLWGNILKKKE